MRSLGTLAVALTLAAALPAQAQDGATLFARQCAGCHKPGAKSTPAAPALQGVFGRPIASLTDFAYSPGLKAEAGHSWSAASLEAYLAAPQTFAPGSAMSRPAGGGRTGGDSRLSQDPSIVPRAG